MKHIFITLSLLCCAFILCAQQHPSCDGQRYLTPIYSELDTTLNVVFGNSTSIGGNNKDLLMDVYEPSGDTATMRPLVILAFGGSFVAGDRSSVADLCEHYAKRGFVAATIDYRLFDGWFIPLPDSIDLIEVVIQAVSDMKAAIRFFREDAATLNKYKIDPNKIFVGGESAGGILASHVAYIDSNDVLDPLEQTFLAAHGGWDGNSSTNTQYSSKVQGVLSFSGALHYARYMNAGEPPLFCAHDDNDNIVPYGNGYATFFGFLPIVSMQGSATMHSKANAEGIYTEMVTITNSSGHVSYASSNSPWRDSVLERSDEFLANILCPSTVNIEEVVLEKNTTVAAFYPNPATTQLTVELENLTSSYTITVYDQMGRLVRHESNLVDHYYELNRQNLPTGIYYVQLTFDDATQLPIKTKVIFQ